MSLNKRRLSAPVYTVAAGTDITLPLAGDFIHILNATGSFKIALDDDPFTTWPASVGASVETFEQIRIQNTDTVDIQVSLLAAFGEIHDNRSSFAGAINTRSGDNIEHGNVSVGDVATPIVAVNTSRTRIEVFNNSTTDRLYVGGAGVTTANTTPIEAGQGRFFDTGAALYGIAETGKTVDTRYLGELE